MRDKIMSPIPPGAKWNRIALGRASPQIRRMNLDALYSELTLKTKAKLVLEVLDGLGDIAT